MNAQVNNAAAARDLASSIAALPPLPATAQKILTCFGDEFIDANKVTEIVEGDAAICGKLLGLANSAYFGLSEPVTKMEEVISRVLGVDTVRSLVLAMAIQRSFNSKRCPGFDVQQFWVRSLTTAECCKRLAMNDGDASDEIKDLSYSTGLCHNLGLMALAHLFPTEASAALEAHKGEETPGLSVLLAEHCGVNHREMTAELGTHWSLPALMSHAYTYRATPIANHPRGLASLLSAAISAVDHADEDVEPTTDLLSLASALNMDPDELQKMARFGERQQSRLESLASNMAS